MPSTAPTSAWKTASRRVSAVTWPVVAPASRSAASRESRRDTASLVAADPRVIKGTARSTNASAARNG